MLNPKRKLLNVFTLIGLYILRSILLLLCVEAEASIHASEKAVGALPTTLSDPSPQSGGGSVRSKYEKTKAKQSLPGNPLTSVASRASQGSGGSSSQATKPVFYGEEGIRKRNHLNVLFSDSRGKEEIDFARVHAALAFEQQQILTTQKNTALMAYSLVVRNKDNGNVSVETFPVLFHSRIRPGGDWGLMYFVSGSPFDGATHTNGVIGEPLTRKDLEVKEGEISETISASTVAPLGANSVPEVAINLEGAFDAVASPTRARRLSTPLKAAVTASAHSDGEAIAMEAGSLERPAIQPLFPRKFYSAKTLYAAEIMDKLNKRHNRPKSGIYGHPFSKEMRKFLIYHEIMQEGSFLNVNQIVKEYGNMLTSMNSYLGDTEQTMLNVLDSDHFQKQVINNVDFCIKDNNEVIGIVIHMHSKYSPCRQCAVSIFADNERDDGCLKTLQRYVASVQSNFSPKVLTLFSYSNVWEGGGSERGSGESFLKRGIDRDFINSVSRKKRGLQFPDVLSEAEESKSSLMEDVTTASAATAVGPLAGVGDLEDEIKPSINPSHFYPFVPIVRIKPDRLSWIILESLYALHIHQDKINTQMSAESSMADPVSDLKFNFYSSKSAPVVSLGIVKGWLAASAPSSMKVEESLFFEDEATLKTEALSIPAELPSEGVKYNTLSTPELYHLNNLHALIQGLGGTDVVRDFLNHILGYRARRDVYGTPSRHSRTLRPFSAPASLGRSPSVEGR